MDDPSMITDAVIAALKEMDRRCYLRGEGTLEIMRRFDELGKKLGFAVSASYAAAEDPEWLYDMTWWRSSPPQSPAAGKEPYMISIAMALETELGLGSNKGDDIDPDFQKLVQARAGVRVWISTSPNDAEQHIENCKEQIRLFDGTQAGDRYVFAVYDWLKQTPVIRTLAFSPNSNS